MQRCEEEESEATGLTLASVCVSKLGRSAKEHSYFEVEEKKKRVVTARAEKCGDGRRQRIGREDEGGITTKPEKNK